MHFKMSSAMWFNLDQSEIVSSGNGLKMISVFDRIENIAVTEENAGYQHFFLSCTMSCKTFFFFILSYKGSRYIYNTI